MKLSPKQLPAFRTALLSWFARRKRDLPWRCTRDPYRIWVAEIMLQQTRVAAVLPYYRRFLARFPSVRALARAPAEQVLRHWSGLGYYRRARHLHRAAKQIVARHSGRFPCELAAALRLPGIGRYTAAAVLSIAYGSPYAVLDGNVARVLARLFALRSKPGTAPQRKVLQGAAQKLQPPEAPGDWNQAAMELGATVCTPRAPRCADCPVARWCRAYRLGIAGQLPAPRRQPAPVRVTLAAAILLDSRGRTLVVRPSGQGAGGSAGALFSRMWQFPAVQAACEPRGKLTQHLRASLGLARPELFALPLARHCVTYRRITLAPFLVPLERLPDLPGARTPLLSRLDRLPISNATRKVAAAALESTRARSELLRISRNLRAAS